MSILVIGATGFIGPRLIRKLIARGEATERVHHSRSGGHGGHTRRLRDRLKHIAVVAGSAVEAAGRAAVRHHIDVRGGQVLGAGFDLGVHPVHAGGALVAVGQPQALAVDGYVTGRDELEVRLERRVR